MEDNQGISDESAAGVNRSYSVHFRSCSCSASTRPSRSAAGPEAAPVWGTVASSGGMKRHLPAQGFGVEEGARPNRRTAECPPQPSPAALPASGHAGPPQHPAQAQQSPVDARADAIEILTESFMINQDSGTTSISVPGIERFRCSVVCQPVQSSCRQWNSPHLWLATRRPYQGHKIRAPTPGCGDNGRCWQADPPLCQDVSVASANLTG